MTACSGSGAGASPTSTTTTPVSFISRTTTPTARTRSRGIPTRSTTAAAPERARRKLLARTGRCRLGIDLQVTDRIADDTRIDRAGAGQLGEHRDHDVARIHLEVAAQ